MGYQKASLVELQKGISYCFCNIYHCSNVSSSVLQFANEKHVTHMSDATTTPACQSGLAKRVTNGEQFNKLQNHRLTPAVPHVLGKRKVEGKHSAISKSKQLQQKKAKKIDLTEESSQYMSRHLPLSHSSIVTQSTASTNVQQKKQSKTKRAKPDSSSLDHLESRVRKRIRSDVEDKTHAPGELPGRVNGRRAPVAGKTHVPGLLDRGKALAVGVDPGLFSWRPIMTGADGIAELSEWDSDGSNEDSSEDISDEELTIPPYK